MHYFQLACCLVFFVFLFSCSNENKYKPQELRIDSLETVLQQAEKALDADTSVLRKRSEKITYEMNAIKLYHTDTIPRELAFMLDDYKRIRKIYVNYMQSTPALNEESEALHTQLKNLRKTLLKGKLADSNFRKFYEIEKGDIEKHYAITTEIGERISLVDSTYNAIYPKIEIVAKQVVPAEK